MMITSIYYNEHVILGSSIIPIQSTFQDQQSIIRP